MGKTTEQESTIIKPAEGNHRLYLVMSMLFSIHSIADEKTAGEPWIEAILELSREAHGIVEEVYSNLLEVGGEQQKII